MAKQSWLMVEWSPPPDNQIEDQRIEPIIQTAGYLKVTAKILKKYNGLWFNDESFVVSKKGI